jgi:flagellar biosynthesis/type III secretory pathway ATPase
MRDVPLRFDAVDGWIRTGVVESVAADHLVVRMPALQPGAIVRVARDAGRPLLARVHSIDTRGAHCTPLERADRVSAGARATSQLARLGAYVGPSLLGRAADAWGRSNAPGTKLVASIDPPPLPLAERAPITAMLRTGIAAVDAFAPLGYGQRIALTAGAGVGKTSLLRRIVERAEVDARVVALVGERAREAAETIRRLEGSSRWSTTSIYSATSDSGPMERYGAAQSAVAQAEWLCARGLRVLLVLDSLTRVASAWREMALAAGEPPAQRGHPPSLVGALARLVERAGARATGTWRSPENWRMPDSFRRSTCCAASAARCPTSHRRRIDRPRRSCATHWPPSNKRKISSRSGRFVQVRILGWTHALRCARTSKG